MQKEKEMQQKKPCIFWRKGKCSRKGGDTGCGIHGTAEETREIDCGSARNVKLAPYGAAGGLPSKG